MLGNRQKATGNRQQGKKIVYLITMRKAINKKPKAKGEQPNNLGLSATLREQPSTT
ncbi:MAG: hypothetical protein F6K44_06920 [Moorea sp. SIO3E2]|nr:hypothetical protein [Moorena sp. SIO3E2]